MLVDYESFNQADSEEWWDIRGDETLRMSYPLTPNSTVIDAGGFEGEWSYNIYSRFQPTIYFIEPVKDFYEKAKKRLVNVPKITTLNYAVSNKTCNAIMAVDGYGSNLFDLEPKKVEEVKCLDIKEMLDTYSITSIDLLKLNIEGSEYDVLERLIELNFLPNIKNIEIQFHSYFPDSKARRNAILERLALTHQQSWNYEWIMESWKLKEK